MFPVASSDRGVLRQFAANAEQRRQVQLRQSLDEVRVRERKIHEERQQVAERRGGQPRCCPPLLPLRPPDAASMVACVHTRHAGAQTYIRLKLSSHTRLGLQILANQENTARRTLDEARASTAKRDKTLVEEVGEWGIEYRNAKEPIKRAIFEPGFASVQKEALNKQMLLPRRNTIQKDMPQWFQQDARNMPDWCVHLRCCGFSEILRPVPS